MNYKEINKVIADLRDLKEKEKESQESQARLQEVISMLSYMQNLGLTHAQKEGIVKMCIYVLENIKNGLTEVIPF